MKIAVLLIVANGDTFYQRWIDYYEACPYVDYIVVSNGFTENWHNAGLPCNIQHVNYNPIKTQILLSRDFHKNKLCQQNYAMGFMPDDTDYIWIADVDEFYHYEDIKTIRKQLEKHEYTYVEFYFNNFWKRLNTIAVGGVKWGFNISVGRIFKYHKGAMFTEHRPISLLGENGVDVQFINPMPLQSDIKCFHYSFINDTLVKEKMMYYAKTFSNDFYNFWFENVYMKWSEYNRNEIEDKYSTHPTNAGAKTKDVNLKNPIILL